MVFWFPPVTVLAGLVAKKVTFYSFGQVLRNLKCPLSGHDIGTGVWLAQSVPSSHGGKQACFWVQE
jgi:hypothetical protein